jgi:hypothetical protein
MAGVRDARPGARWFDCGLAWLGSRSGRLCRARTVPGAGTGSPNRYPGLRPGAALRAEPCARTNFRRRSPRSRWALTSPEAEAESGVRARPRHRRKWGRKRVRVLTSGSARPVQRMPAAWNPPIGPRRPRSRPGRWARSSRTDDGGACPVSVGLHPRTVPRIRRYLGWPQVRVRTLYQRVLLAAIWRRPKLTARGDPAHDQVVAGIVALLPELPRRSVVLADETHRNLLPHVRASWTPRGLRPGVLTPGTTARSPCWGRSR